MPAAKYEIKRKCECCGATFIAKTLDSIYCSAVCSRKAYEQKRADEKKRKQLDEMIAQIPDARDYISVSEAEAMFGVCAKTIRRLIRSGQVSSINLGARLTRVSRTELLNRLPLRGEPIDRSKPLPKQYSLEPEDCYTIGQISQMFGMNDSTVYGHIRKYSIPTRQIGNYVYAPKSEIDHLYKDVVKL
jgi:predicted DNA-binding transcriptional regulator AlpA/uncharacterized Zn finger protein (UPF0148 family)